MTRLPPNKLLQQTTQANPAYTHNEQTSQPISLTQVARLYHKTQANAQATFNALVNKSSPI